MCPVLDPVIEVRNSYPDTNIGEARFARLSKVLVKGSGRRQHGHLVIAGRMANELEVGDNLGAASRGVTNAGDAEAEPLVSHYVAQSRTRWRKEARFDAP